MLPETLLNHPYFHRELDEESAKTVLSLDKKSNFLFCKSEKPDRFLLIYKSMYKGVEEIRSLSMKIRNRPGRLIDGGNLDAGPMGILKSLYAISQKLSTLSSGWIGTPFSPVALLSSDVDVEAQLAAQHAEEEGHFAKQVKKVKMIYKSLPKLLSMPLQIQAWPEPNQRIEHRGYVIHSPQFYSFSGISGTTVTFSEISATVISPDHGSAQVLFSDTNINLAPCSAESSLLSDPDLLDRLFELCVMSKVKNVLSSSAELVSSSVDKKALKAARAVVLSASGTLECQITENLRLEFSCKYPDIGILMKLYKKEGIELEQLLIDGEMQDQVIALQSTLSELTAYLRTQGRSSTKIANIIDSDTLNLAPDASSNAGSSSHYTSLPERFVYFKKKPATSTAKSPVDVEFPEGGRGERYRSVSF